MTDNKRKIHRVARRAGSYKLYRKPVERLNNQRDNDPKVIERKRKRQLAYLKSIEATESADFGNEHQCQLKRKTNKDSPKVLGEVYEPSKAKNSL